MNTLEVVVGGQFGSESKGRVCGNLAQVRKAEGKRVIGVRVAGPNAGHVVLDAQGQRFALRQVPVSMVTDPLSIGVIAAGSEIDLAVLTNEVETLQNAGHHIADRLYIDTQATMLERRHHVAEGGNDGELQNRLGSTGKGVGAARADRIWRKAAIVEDHAAFDGLGYLMSNTAAYLDDALRDRSSNGTAVLIEGTQGYGLGLHAGHYPHCTSSDCRAIDFLSMVGLSPWAYPPRVEFDAVFGHGQMSNKGRVEFAVWVVLRAYPIRVAGNSGPMNNETNWDELGLEAEYTTVTKKIRRVGHWDPALAKQAVRANGGARARIALAMADQRYPQIAGCKTWDEIPAVGLLDEGGEGGRAELADWIDQIEQETGARVWTVGTGPDSTIWLPRDARRPSQAATEQAQDATDAAWAHHYVTGGGL